MDNDFKILLDPFDYGASAVIKDAIKNRYIIIVPDAKTAVKMQQKACGMAGFSPVIVTEDEVINSEVDLGDFVKKEHKIVIYNADSVISKALDKYFGTHISIANIKGEV